MLLATLFLLNLPLLHLPLIQRVPLLSGHRLLRRKPLVESSFVTLGSLVLELFVPLPDFRQHFDREAEALLLFSQFL